MVGAKGRFLVTAPSKGLEINHAGCNLGSCHSRVLRHIRRLCAFLRPDEVGYFIDTQSLIMLIISALTTAYLFYALLRPEKF